MGETAWDNFGSLISYEGAQDGFANLDETQNNEIDEWECGMHRYMDIHNIHLDVQWGMSKSKILPRIEEMLQNDIPVI